MGLLKSLFGGDDKKKSSTKKTAAKKATKSAAKKETKPAAKKEEKKINFKDPFAKNMVTVKAGMFNQKSEYSYQTNHGDRRRKMETCYGIHVRRVTISKDYLMCKYEVTQGDWKAVMGEGFNPSHFRDDDDLPVESVSWDEVQEFIKKLNKLTGKKYRLPTEAEWEWAAKGASKDKDQGCWAGCNKYEDLVKYAWIKPNSEGKTHPVGKKKPNEIGLYDMNGNVDEWCQDTRRFDLGTEAVVDPLECQQDNKNHTVRGGFYNCTLIQLSYDLCPDRGHDSIGQRNIGFRLAMSIE